MYTIVVSCFGEFMITNSYANEYAIEHKVRAYSKSDVNCVSHSLYISISLVVYIWGSNLVYRN